MDVQPMIVENHTLLPVCFIAYALGAEVDWNSATEDTPVTITLTLGEQSINFAIGEFIPGMNVPAQLINNRTMVPVRFISKFFGAVVTWNAEDRSIEIIFNSAYSLTDEV